MPESGKSRKRYHAKLVHGTIKRSPGGLKKSDIKTVVKGEKVRYVSKKRSAQAKNNFAGWNEAVKEAKKQLGIPLKGEFVLVKKGTDLYNVARAIYDRSKRMSFY